MNFVKDAYRRTNEIARGWSASGRRFGSSSDKVARELTRSGESWVKKTRRSR